MPMSSEKAQILMCIQNMAGVQSQLPNKIGEASCYPLCPKKISGLR